MAQIVLIDPFHTGSHASFSNTVMANLDAQWTMLSLPGRHWKWRMRGAAVHFAADLEDLPKPPDLIVTTSMLSLTDLIALAPSLGNVPTFLYFHENQLTYPQRDDAGIGRPRPHIERDHHFGFTQLVSARAATACGFNSRYNLESFLSAGRALLTALPDAVPPGWVDDIRAKSDVFFVPVLLAPVAIPPGEAPDPRGPTVLWNHRWEHDKRPEVFFRALEALEARGERFRLALAGPDTLDGPHVSTKRAQRGPEGSCSSDRARHVIRTKNCCVRSDIAVSTAAHEFFGISMLEATHFGAYPLVPDGLAYPEIFPIEHRYRDANDLVARLAEACRRYRTGGSLRAARPHITARFGRDALQALAVRWTELSKKPVRLKNMVSNQRV